MRKLTILLFLAATCFGQQPINGYRTWYEAAAPGGTPAAGQWYVYLKSGVGLCEKNSSGTETCFGSGVGSPAWSNLQDPSGALALTMGPTHTTTWTVTGNTGSAVMFEIKDATANTGTGYLLGIQSVGTSTIRPFRFTAQGTVNGIDMDSNGFVAVIGTGRISASHLALAANPANCSGNNWALGIDAQGVAECAQPALSNLTGFTSGATDRIALYSNATGIDSNAAFYVDRTNFYIYSDRSQSGAQGGLMRARNTAALASGAYAGVQACAGPNSSDCLSMVGGYLNDDSLGTNYWHKFISGTISNTPWGAWGQQAGKFYLAGGVQIVSNKFYTFTSSPTIHGAAADSGIERAAAGLMGPNNGTTAGAVRDWFARGYAITRTNAGTTGTTAKLTTKIDASGNAIIGTTADTKGIKGICLSGCGTTGSAYIVTQGQVTVTADNTVAIGDYIINGTVADGRSRSAGATKPTDGTQVLGTALSAATVGNDFDLLMTSEDTDNNSGGTAHNILSGTHSDTTGAGSEARGDLFVRNGSSQWTRLAVGGATTVLHGGTDPSYSAVSLTADVSGILPGANGGTNNGFMQFSGPAASLKTYTLPNVSESIATLGQAQTFTAIQTLNTGTTPGNVLLLDIAAIGSAGTRDSHDTTWRGRSDDGAGHLTEWKAFADVTSNAGASTFTVQSRIDGAGFANRLTITDGSVVGATIFDAGTGFRIGGAATSGNFLRGNGANFVSTALNVDDVSAPEGCQDAGSTDAYACSLTPAPAGYTTGTRYRFKANTINTGAASINFNTLGALTIKKLEGAITTDLADGDIRAGQWVEVVYDGTNAQMVSPLGRAVTGTGSTMLATNPTNILLDSEGSGNSLIRKVVMWLEAASCAGTTGTLAWDTLATNAPTAACSAGGTETTLMRGTADFPDSDGDYSLQRAFMWPADWTGVVDLKFLWRAGATTGDVVFQATLVCRADGEVDDAAFNSANPVTDTAKGTANQLNTASIASMTLTGCAAGEYAHLKVLRNRTHANDSIAGVVSLAGVEMTARVSK